VAYEALKIHQNVLPYLISRDGKYGKTFSNGWQMN